MMAANPYSDRDVLEIFIETVEELQSSEFVKQVKNGVRVGLMARPAHIISQCVGPEREAVKAFLLTLRFFLQDNEITSFGKMAKRVAILNIDQPLKDEFLNSRKNLNAFLDAPLNVTVHGAGADTKREVLQAFLYGIYAHADPRQRRKVKCWETTPFYGDLEAHFYIIGAHLVAAATVMAETCRKILASGQV